jgi:isoleucyl-tRNA synthetase
MDDWLRNMGDWNISRRRYFGLPLPLWRCESGHLTVVGSKAELAERAASGMDQLEELHRPWVDNVLIRCEECGEEARRIPEVGDVWLDAGIVPFSSLGWQNPEWVEGGYATGASAGLSTADLPDHAYWEEWFPAHWVSEMREQIRLWFYSQLFMSVALVGWAPFREVLGYEKMLDERGREMHGSWGNMIEAEDAFDRMGADVVRWQFCAQPPDRNLLFGYGPAYEIKRELLTLWHSVRFLVDYANIEGFRPRFEDLAAGPTDAELRPLDRWQVARAQQLVAEATAALEDQLTHRLVDAFESYVEDLSNWYIRRSRRRFYGLDEAAFRTLWYSLVQALRVIAPVMPFLADHLWRELVAEPCEGAPDSVHLAGWPEPVDALADPALLAEMEEVREVVELGRRARDAAGLKLRQPLRRAVVYGSGAAVRWADEIRDELRVKEVVLEEGPAVRFTYKPNLRVLGPRLGKELPALRAALASGEVQELGDGRVRVAGHEHGPDVLIVERHEEPGWAHSERFSVQLDTELDDELRREGRVLDLVRRLNDLRKQAGLELTDRIVVRLPSELAELAERHGDWIKAEVLAVRIELDGAEGEPVIEKAS